MTTHRAHHRTRRARRAAVVGVTGAAVLVFSGGPAVAQDDPESTDEPPGYVAPEPPEVDPDAPGLMLGDGATLAEPRVLDIKFITEDLGTGGTGDSDDGSGGTGGEDGSSTGGEDGSGGGEDSSGGGEDSGADEPPSGGQREEQTGGQHKFTLQTDVLFGRDSDEITDEAREAARDYIDDMQDDTGWTPTRSVTVAGALQYREYDFVTRLVMRVLMRHGDHPTDITRDYDYTDWEAVEGFARDFSGLLGRPVS